MRPRKGEAGNLIKSHTLERAPVEIKLFLTHSAQSNLPLFAMGGLSSLRADHEMRRATRLDGQKWADHKVESQRRQAE